MTPGGWPDKVHLAGHLVHSMRVLFLKILIASGVASLLWILLHPAHRVLEISDPRSDRPLFCAEMADGEDFVLSFVHSVNKRPVFDTLRVDGDRLIIVKSRFDSFGAGMPEESGSEGRLEFDSDGWLVWSVWRPVPLLNLFVGRDAQHGVHIRGSQRALAELAEPGTSLSIRSTRISLLELLRRSCLK